MTDDNVTELMFTSPVAAEAFVRVIRERDEAREVAQRLHWYLKWYFRDTNDVSIKFADDLTAKYPWLEKEADNGTL